MGREFTSWGGQDFENSECILIWGINPADTILTDWNKMQRAKERGAKLIVVDPVFTKTASHADLWLQIKPGTDAALALGMLNLIIEEGLYDEEFVSKWCVGFDSLKERVKDYPLEKVSRITWLSEEKIKEAARIYAKAKSATIRLLLGLMQQWNSVQTVRAITILPAITGNIDKKGGFLMPGRIQGFVSTWEILSGQQMRLPQDIESKAIGYDRFPLYCQAGNAHTPSVIKAIITGEPYPLRAMLLSGANLVMHCANTREVWDALNRLEFLVVADLFMTPTAELADVVLPAASWMERDDICDIFYFNFVGFQQKVIEPIGECWDDKKIFLELAKRMELRKFLPWDTVEEYLEFRLKDTGLSFNDLKERAGLTIPTEYRKFEKRGFSTPSGKIEVYSSIFEKYGYDPLPSYKEPPEGSANTPELVGGYPLILITITESNRQVYYLSEGRGFPWARKIVPDPLVKIHSETGKELGVKDGDWVWIETPLGRIKQKAKFTEGIHPKVISAPYGWWFPEKPGPEHGCFESNINTIITSDLSYCDPISGASTMRSGLLCRLRPVEVEKDRLEE